MIGVRQALDYRSTSRAIAVCVVAWLLSFGVVVVGVDGVQHQSELAMSTAGRALMVWFVMLIVASANGAFRETVLIAKTGVHRTTGKMTVYAKHK